MVRLRKGTVKAALEMVGDRFKTFKKNLSKDAIGVFGGLLILTVILIAGTILWISDKFNKKKDRDAFFHD
jgi:hypothetical protein